MRSVTLSLILLAGVAAHADAQGSRLTAPIAKAREVSATADARAKAINAGQEPAPRRDSATDAVTGAPATQKPGRPALPPVNGTSAAAGTSGAAKAPAKPETTSANTPASKTSAPAPAAKPADSAKAPASGKAATAAQVTPGKSPAGGKAPAGASTTAAGTKTAPGSKTAPVTPDSTKPSSTVEAAKGARQPTSVGSAPSSRPEIAINREVFTYDAAGRRDPFASLLMTSDLRPLFSDLLLVVINYDPQGRNSVAIMRDATTKEQYRVRQGQLIGRMRVAAIEPKRVMFTIDEFGFSRQETLVIGDTTKVRKQ